MSNNFGKFGIINLSDVFTRKQEFQAWFIEIKGRSLKEINPHNEKKYLLEFIDEFNNSRFPSRKYYDSVKWQAKKIDKILRLRKREKDKLQTKSSLQHYSQNIQQDFIFDDERNKEKEKIIMKEIEQKRKLEDAIYTMNKEKAEAMKESEFKGNLIRHYYQTGDIVTAKEMHKQYYGNKNEDKDKEKIPEDLDDNDGGN
jgi:hypothetical protein